MWPQVKECWQPPEAEDARMGSPLSEGSVALLTPGLWPRETEFGLQIPELEDNTFLLCKATPLVVIHDFKQHRKLVQQPYCLIQNQVCI